MAEDNSVTGFYDVTHEPTTLPTPHSRDVQQVCLSPVEDDDVVAVEYLDEHQNVLYSQRNQRDHVVDILASHGGEYAIGVPEEN